MSSITLENGHPWPGPGDPTVQAYLLRNLSRVDPEVLNRNLRGVLNLLTQFDSDLTMEVLRHLDDQSVPGLSRLLLHLVWEDPRPELQAKLLHLLGTQSDREDHVPELLRLRSQLQDPRPVSALVRVLGKAGRNLPFKLFKPFLSHPDARIRANSVETLLERLHPRLTEVFSTLVNDPSPRVQALAALALWRLGQPTLASLLDESSQPRNLSALAHAAGRAGQDSRLTRSLVSLAGSQRQPEEVRRIAARSLAGTASRLDIPRLIGLAFKGQGNGLRSDLIQSACSLHAEDTASHLVRSLARLDGPTHVKLLSSTLSLIGDLPIRPDAELLMPYVAFPDDRVVANAVETLAKYQGDPQVDSALQRSLFHAHGRVAANSAVALWKRGHIAAFGRVRALAQHASSAVRASAAWALGRIGGLLSQDVAQTLLEDSDDRVQKWAFEALRAG